MSEKKDIRWVQRYENFRNAFLRLKEAVELDELNELERNGLVQRFEFTIEMAWKVMKDFLVEQGFDFKPIPKETFRLAQQSRFIDCARELIEGLELRNELSHDYSGEKFVRAEKKLREESFSALVKLNEFFTGELEKMRE